MPLLASSPGWKVLHGQLAVKDLTRFHFLQINPVLITIHLLSMEDFALRLLKNNHKQEKSLCPRLPAEGPCGQYEGLWGPYLTRIANFTNQVSQTPKCINKPDLFYQLTYCDHNHPISLCTSTHWVISQFFSWHPDNRQNHHLARDLQWVPESDGNTPRLPSVWESAGESNQGRTTPYSSNAYFVIEQFWHLPVYTHKTR